MVAHARGSTVQGLHRVPRRGGGGQQVSGDDRPARVRIDKAPHAAHVCDRVLAIGDGALLPEEQAGGDVVGAADDAGDGVVVGPGRDAELADAIGIDADDHAGDGPTSSAGATS